MYCGRDWDPSDTVENQTYGLDFVDDLQTGETLTTATWYCTVAPDSPAADATPSARLIGSAWLQTSTITAQQVAGLLVGVKYVLQAVVTTSLGNTLSLFSHVTCEAIA